MYNGYCGGYGWHHGTAQQPPVNIKETGSEYILHLYAPSLKKEAINITTKGDVLSIKYEDKEVSENFTRRELNTNTIYRSFDLKGKVLVNAINASYADGVLKIVLPKTEAAQRDAQNVEIK